MVLMGTILLVPFVLMIIAMGMMTTDMVTMIGMVVGLIIIISSTSSSIMICTVGHVIWAAVAADALVRRPGRCLYRRFGDALSRCARLGLRLECQVLQSPADPVVGGQ
jgi:hypothetical protein